MPACSGSSNKPGSSSEDSGEPATTIEFIEYELTLRIVLPLNQGNLFDSVDRLDIVVNEDGAEVDRYSLEEVQRGELGRGNDSLPALDGATIALEGFGADGSLVAYGESSPVTLNEGEAEAYIFVARTDAFGWLYNLASPSVGAALVADGNGDLLLFGGTVSAAPTAAILGRASTSVRRLDLNQAEEGLVFSTVGSMPAFPSGAVSDPGRAGHTAVRLGGTHDHKDYILVAGGSTDFWDSTQVTNTAFLWDPTTDTVAGELELSSPLTHHVAVADAAGNVVLSGGSTRDDNAASTYVAHRDMYFFDGASLQFSHLSVPSSARPWIHHAAARYSDRGVLLCGGFGFPSGETDPYEVFDGCAVVSTSGSYTQRSSSGVTLPEPRFHHAMIGLSDGKVLVTGGASYDGVEYTVSNQAWVLDPSTNTWTDVGPMHLARAQHAMTLLPDGRVLVVGGVTAQSDHWWSGNNAVACAEVYNPDLGDFVEVGTCTPTSTDGALPEQVARPAIATEPVRGMAVVVGGMTTNDVGGTGVALYVPPAD